MRWFNDIKNKIKDMINRSRTQKLPEAQMNWFNDPSFLGTHRELTGSNGQRVELTALNQYGENYMSHDGTSNKLMVATFLPLGQDGTIFRGTNKYIAFEMPSDVDAKSANVLNMAMTYYQYLNADFKDYDCQFIGNLFKTNSQEYMQYMQNYVDENIGQQIKSYKEQQQIVRDEINKQNEELRAGQLLEERIIQNAEIQEKRYNQDSQRAARMHNPKMDYMNSYTANDGKKYFDYNANNLENGYVLKIRQLGKMAKDENGRYIYKGYVENALDENDAEVLNKYAKPVGIPVVFTTDKKVEDIVAQNNPYEIQQLSMLLSKEENFRNNNRYMNYIGNLDRNGNITRGEDNSKAINNEITRLQTVAYQEMMQGREEQNRE